MRIVALAPWFHIAVNCLLQMDNNRTRLIVYGVILVMKATCTVTVVQATFCRPGVEAFVIHGATDDNIGEHRSLQKR